MKLSSVVVPLGAFSNGGLSRQARPMVVFSQSYPESYVDFFDKSLADNDYTRRWRQALEPVRLRGFYATPTEKVPSAPVGSTFLHCLEGVFD